MGPVREGQPRAVSPAGVLRRGRARETLRPGRGGLLCVAACSVGVDRKARARVERHIDQSRPQLSGLDPRGRTARPVGPGEPTASTTLALPVAAFCSAHPGARVEVDTRVSTTELRRQLLEFELDVAIAPFAREDRAGLHVVPLYEEKYVVLASVDRLPLEGDVMTWADAAKLPLPLLPPAMRIG